MEGEESTRRSGAISMRHALSRTLPAGEEKGTFILLRSSREVVALDSLCVVFRGAGGLLADPDARPCLASMAATRKAGRAGCCGE